MRTGHRILKTAFLALFVCFALEINAQNSDTVRTSPFDRYWTRQRLVPKLGVGVQERAFVEIGLYWQNIYKHPLSLASKGPYATVDIFIDENNLLLGPKIGYELTAGVLGTALDLTYFIDEDYDKEGSDRKAFVLTPKVGLTILGFADVYYGYQIPLSDTQITSISRNRFSLVINLNKDYFDLKGAPRR